MAREEFDLFFLILNNFNVHTIIHHSPLTVLIPIATISPDWL